MITISLCMIVKNEEKNLRRVGQSPERGQREPGDGSHGVP